MKFNPFEEGKEYKPEDDEPELDMDYFESDGKVDIEEILEWYMNDSEGSAEFMQNCRDIYKLAAKKDFSEESIKKNLIEMVKEGLIKVYFDIAFGHAGLMLKMEDGTWKEV